MGKTSVNYSDSLSYTATGNWDKVKRCQKFPGSDGCRMGLLPVPTTGRAKKQVNAWIVWTPKLLESFLLLVSFFIVGRIREKLVFSMYNTFQTST